MSKVNFDSDVPRNSIKITFIREKNDIINSLPADLSVITADGTNKANYNGAMIYATDLEGKVTKINLTENFILGGDNIINKNISTTTLFDVQGNSDNGRYIFKAPEVTINNDKSLWMYFGTGNTQKLQDQSNL